VAGAAYDDLGRGYSGVRRADPRIAGCIEEALGDARSVLNVGAGTGSYEPADREVTAVEPSLEMIDQRPEGSAPVVQGVAEALPFDNDSFDAAMGVLTIHHWANLDTGLAEMQRVARRRILIVTFDPEVLRELWIVRDYFPGMLQATQGKRRAVVWRLSFPAPQSPRSRCPMTAAITSSLPYGRDPSCSSTPRWCGRCGCGSDYPRRRGERAAIDSLPIWRPGHGILSTDNCGRPRSWMSGYVLSLVSWPASRKGDVSVMQATVSSAHRADQSGRPDDSARSCAGVLPLGPLFAAHALGR